YDRRPEAIGEPGDGTGPAAGATVDVPLVVDGKPWGTLHLAADDGAGFSEADRHTAEILGTWISIAIGNAQVYREIERQRDDLRRANRALEAATEIARAVGGQTELTPILET